MAKVKLNPYQLTSYEKKVIGLSALGGMLEFYDFIIYGIFSVYFADQIFPSNNALLSIIESYSVFVLGYLIRPIGGMIFSHIGDEHGRKRVLVTTIVLMGIASLGIGLLPTYAQIGVWAPLSLILLRLLQGLAIGGELPATYVYISESMPTKRGSGFGLTMAGIVSGLLLGFIINQALSLAFSKEQLISFGWRIPFIFGGVVCLVSYKIRKSLQETQAFQKITHHVKYPIMYMLTNYAWQVLGGVIITGVLGAIIVTNIVFMPTYLIKIVHLKAAQVNLAILVAMVLYVLMTYVVGRINNHLAVKPLLIVGFVVDLGLIVIGYWLLAHGLYLQLALILLAVSVAVPTVCVPHLLSLMFPVQVRLSGVALAYNIGFGIFGGMVPIVITYFIKSGGNIFMVPAVFLGLILIAGLVAVRFISQSKVN